MRPREARRGRGRVSEAVVGEAEGLPQDATKAASEDDVNGEVTERIDDHQQLANCVETIKIIEVNKLKFTIFEINVAIQNFLGTT